MIVNLQQYDGVAVVQGVQAPIGGDMTATGESLTADGDFTDLDAETNLIRVATDTAVYFSTKTGADDTNHFLPAGTVEFFRVHGGETCSVATA